MPKLHLQPLSNFANKKSAFIILLLCLLAGEAFAAPRFFDGNKNREIQISQQPSNAQDATSPQLRTVQFFYNTLYYNLYFSQENIAALNTAFQNYNSDFENRKLSRKDKKSLKKYGTFTTRLEWGTSRQNMNAFSQNTNATLGYAFAKKSPYFVIAIQSVQNQAQESPALAQSGNVYLLFTKAQIGELIQLLQ